MLFWPSGVTNPLPCTLTGRRLGPNSGFKHGCWPPRSLKHGAEDVMRSKSVQLGRFAVLQNGGKPMVFLWCLYIFGKLSGQARGAPMTKAKATLWAPRQLLASTLRPEILGKAAPKPCRGGWKGQSCAPIRLLTPPEPEKRFESMPFWPFGVTNPLPRTLPGGRLGPNSGLKHGCWPPRSLQHGAEAVQLGRGAVLQNG